MKLELAALVLLSCACRTEELTQVVVQVEVESPIIAESGGNNISVTVSTWPESPLKAPEVLTGNSSAPLRDGRYSIGLSPLSPANPGRYLVEVSALQNGVPFATARLISGYVVDETRYVRLRLESMCARVSCPADQSCHAGRCVDARRAQSGFASSSGAAPNSYDLPIATLLVPDAGEARAPSDGSAGTAEDLGPGTSTSDSRDAGGPAALPGISADAGAQLRRVRTLAVGRSHNCARRSDGTVACWGFNGGKLGNGSLESSRVPVPAQGLTGVVELVAGGFHTCARRADGRVLCWGDNQYGQLGIAGNATVATIPTLVQDLDGVVELTAGFAQTCARKSDTSVWCWGLNLFAMTRNQGDPSPTYPRPVRIDSLTDVAELSAGWYHICARKTDGTVVCWGENGEGQLGNSSKQPSATPLMVPGVNDATQLSSGSRHTCALTKDGILCWGEGIASQLGRPSDSQPVGKVQYDLTGVVEVEAGTSHTCARKRDGSVSCWGNNVNGTLGGGTDEPCCGLVAVKGLSGAKELAARDHTCARRSDDSLVCWGPGTKDPIAQTQGPAEANDQPEPVVGF